MKSKKREKKDKLIFRRVFVAIGFIFLLNLGAFFYKFGNGKNVTGLSVKEGIAELYNTMPLASRIFLVTQWVLLFLLLIFVSFRDRNVKKLNEEISGINLNKLKVRKGTDLDTLYNILRKKKQLRIATVAKLFKIKKDAAEEWCEILENGNLAVVDTVKGSRVVKLS